MREREGKGVKEDSPLAGRRKIREFALSCPFKDAL
jgi:hypothetical protein